MTNQAYAIGLVVGKNAVNRRNDVELVQKLLNRALDNYPKFKATGIKKLAVDGICGTLTLSAIEKFQQTVLGWNGSAVDGRIEPNKQTWKKLNGNLSSMQAIFPWIVPMPFFDLFELPLEPKLTSQKQNLPKSMPIAQKEISNVSASDYIMFDQNDYSIKESLGKGQSNIHNSGCLLCTLTMAAKVIGNLGDNECSPKELTPQTVNEILKQQSGAFSGSDISTVPAAKALGMQCDDSGKDVPLKDAKRDYHVQRIINHLKKGYPVAAHVDYHRAKNQSIKAEFKADHWILITDCTGDIFTCLDPGGGIKTYLTSDVKKYTGKRETEGGILFGCKKSPTSNKKEYVVKRFALLSPLTR